MPKSSSRKLGDAVTLMHILGCMVLGALWRLMKGGTLRAGTAPLAAVTFPPMGNSRPREVDASAGRCRLRLAGRFKPEWHAVLGEPWRGGSWFGFLASASAAIFWRTL